ncbi:MAG: hypothetical protein ACO3IV_03030 [Ilumatobacteraceae bacterium]
MGTRYDADDTGRGASRHRRRVVVAVVVGVLVAVGCAPVKLDSTYVGDARSKAFTKAPEPWTVIDVQEQPALSVRGFWAPGGSQKNLLSAGVVPSGVVVRRMPTSEDELDLDVLSRQVVFVELESALEQGFASLLEGPTDRRLSSLDGEQIVYDLVLPNGTIKVMQLTVADVRQNEVYGVVVGCNTACFDSNRTTIERIVGNFRIDK